MNSVNTNVGSLVAMANMEKQQKAMESAMQRLSSGLRINSAGDDAAGSAIASKMTAQVRSLEQAIRNGNDAISLTQTAEGALGEIENILQRMRELSVQAGNSTLNANDRAQIQNEMDQLAAEIDSISSKTNFNKVKLLDGSSAKVTMQIGIDATDALDIALQKTNVSALGIGTTGVSSTGKLISARMTQFAGDIAKTDIQINGKDWTKTDFDVNATSIDGTSTDVSGAIAAASEQAGGLAVKINENTAEHGVTARAFNQIKSGTATYVSGDVAINGTTVKAQSSKEAFVAAVNDQVANVSASIDADGFIVFSNEDGDAIQFAGANPEVGIADDIYAGFVELTSTSGDPITIMAGNKPNGYAGLAGTIADVQDIGFNEVKLNNKGEATVTGSGPVDGTKLQATDGLKINGVLVKELESQGSSAINATDKIAAINAITDQTGVVASGFNQLKVTVDLVSPTMGNHDKIAVNGITIDASSVTTMASLVTTLNNGLAGKSTTSASIDSATGSLLLSNNDGGTISFDDSDDGTGQGDLFTAATYVDGTAATTAFSGGTVTARGFVTLTSQDGSAIKIEDGVKDRDGDDGADRIGFESQNEVDTGSKGVNVLSTSSATTSLGNLDDAIETVSKFRASFGAYENRLEASLNNLLTLQVNTDAARARIEDADFAGETSKLTKAQILNQAATSMLAQANASKQNLLVLLQG